ncbi:IS110 family transposase [candidate division KSB1 bacterium]|nr:IS110 family transposase [candidate division KSB1 bacterium]
MAVNTRGSADKLYQGKINKQSNKYLRTAFIEAALVAIRKDPGLKAYYEYKKATKGHGKAIVATARKLAKAVYFMLRNNELYRGTKIKPAWITNNSANNG